MCLLVLWVCCFCELCACCFVGSLFLLFLLGCEVESKKGKEMWAQLTGAGVLACWAHNPKVHNQRQQTHTFCSFLLLFPPFLPDPIWWNIKWKFFTLFSRSGVAQWLACWAHNPKVPGLKPGSAMFVLTQGPLCSAVGAAVAGFVGLCVCWLCGFVCFGGLCVCCFCGVCLLVLWRCVLVGFVVLCVCWVCGCLWVVCLLVVTVKDKNILIVFALE